MQEIELRHLRVLRAVAEAGSLSKAAVKLGISQPTLTGQIQRLERHLGGPLFSRTTVGVEPTDLGGYVLGAARIVLTEFDLLMAEARKRAVPAVADHTVVVGGPPGKVVAWFATALAGNLSMRDAPIVVEQPDELVRQVGRGALDFALLEDFTHFRTPLPDGVHGRVVLRPHIFVALPEAHPLRSAELIDLAALASDYWVVPPVTDGPAQLAFLRACTIAGFTPAIRHQVADSNTVRALVAAGALGLARATATDGQGIVVRGLVDTPISQEIVVIWRAGGRFASFADLACDTAVDAFAEQTRASPLFQDWWRNHGPSR